MSDKMLIDASHKEETRVVVVRGNRIEEFDFESQHKKQLRGNIYLAKVTRVEPSLQAAFVDYGGNRHGFLAFSEIHPDYYQIPLADRQALLAAEAEAEAERARSENEEDEVEENAAAASAVTAAGQEAESTDETDEVEAKPQKAKGRSRRGRRKAEPQAAADEDTVQSADEDAGETAEDEAGEDAESAAGDEAEGGAEDTAGPKTIAAMVEVDEVSEEVGRRSDDDRDPGEVDLEAAQHVEGKIEAPLVAPSHAEDDGNAAVSEDESEDEDDGDEDGGTDNESGNARQNRRQPRGKRRGGSEDRDDENGGKVESVGAEDALEELPDRSFVKKPRKQYRIQEVIKRRQIMLVQVVKEERGNKGAALTTYLSLAGRYSVLMPNTARGGGISRKITNVADRKRLKDVARGLEVPQGMGVILRTAGANRTKAEVKRDFEYLMRLWENVRNLTLASTAPCLVYEEGSLIKRSIRDLYNKDIGEVVVSGEEGYREAKDFMKMLMPSHAKVVQPYRDIHPIFSRSGIEAQLDRMLQPQVTLKSGGYIIINQTEALVAIDVNSGRSTKEHSIEDTALQTNLEAADEVARQLRLRDLAGLIVVDFIDMEEKRNNRSVEKRLKDALKNDRARIQVGRISHFGLLEMSRQRIRASVLESTTQVCEHCGGTGHVRSQSSVALHVLRSIEEFLLKSTTHDITVRTTPTTALYLLNQKRETIIEMERRFGVAITIEADATIGAAHLAIDRGMAVETPVKIENIVALELAYADEDDDDDIVPTFDEEEEEEVEAPAPARAVERTSTARSETDETDGENGQRGKRRRRRRRRGGRDRDEDGAPKTASATDPAEAMDEDDEDDGAEEAVTTARAEPDADGERPKKRRRRGKRGGRRNRPDEEDAANGAGDGETVEQDAASAGEAEAESGLETGGEPLPEQTGGAVDETVDDRAEVAEAAASLQGDETATLLPDVSDEAPQEKPKKRRAAPRRKKAAKAEAETVAAPEEPAAADATPEAVSEPAAAAEAEPEPTREPVQPAAPVVSADDEAAPDKPKKGGWWQRRGFF